MRFSLLAFLLLTGLLSTAAFAAEEPRIEVLSASDHGVDLRFHLPNLDIEDVAIDGTEYQIAAIPGGGLSGQIGQPGIPTFSRFVAIPARADVRITATVEQEEEIRGIRLLPVQADEGEQFSLDAAAYQRDDFGPAASASAASPAILRGLRVVPVTFEPVRFNPARGILKLARTMRVQVEFTGESDENALEASASDAPIPPSFDSLYRGLVVNYGQAMGNRAVEPGMVLLICANHDSVRAYLQPWVDWRTRKGAKVRLATTAETGTTANAIKSYIQNAYDTWDPRPEYVVLAGDASGSNSIPTFFENLSGYNGEGDHPYTQLAGNDILADVHIGRLSFSSFLELRAIVNKVVGYESTPYTTEASWFRRACLVGDPGASGYSTVQVQQWIKERLRAMGYSEIDTIFAEPFVTQMATALNKGDSVFSYRGWLGMSGWQNSNTYALSNGWKMPFVVTITCGTGGFSGESACRTEGFLRANAGWRNPKGGIGAIGTATSGTHTRYNNCVHYGIFQGLMYEQQWTLGSALTRGKLELYLNYQKSEPDRVTIWSYWNNLMGDPVVDCWTGFPETLTVQHPATLPVGANAVAVTVLRAGSPEPDAGVCLVKGTETFAVGFTDASGRIELPIDAATAGNMLLTVTKHDRAPYKATIPVSPQTFVGYEASTIDDDASGESSGNGDDLWNPGETIELPVQLRNFGGAAVNNVAATIATEDPYLSIVDATETFGNMPAGSLAWSADDFGMRLDEGCPDGRVLRLGLDITSDAGGWHSLIELTATSADLVAESHTLYNAGGNDQLDPGETVEMSVRLRNDGHAHAASVSGQLVSLSPFVTVNDDAGSFGTINMGGTGDNAGDRFGLSASSETFPGHQAQLAIITTFSGGARDTAMVTLMIGSQGTDDPAGPDAYGYYAFDNTDTAYPDAPTYSWIEIDPAHGGSGTQLNIPDNGTYQDKSLTIDLPFTFRYYGTDYSRATVCSNGWIAMGRTYLTDYRNWVLPGAGGPNGIICGFWDDLNLGGGGKILNWHDAANHRFIVEWSRVRNEPGSTQTFEIIFFDPAFYQTESGDGIILMQYDTVTNNDSVDNYTTVGLESPDGTIGLTYTYANTYWPGAATLAAGRAIRFLPVTMNPAGTLSGRVTNAGNGEPLAGAEVYVVENGRVFGTGGDGRYGGSLGAGSYTIIGRHEGFSPDTVENVVVQVGQVTNLDFALVDAVAPSITTTTHPSTSDTLGPYPIPVTITDASGLAEQTLHYRIYGDTFETLPLNPQGGDDYLAQIPGQDYITRVEYYVHARDAGGQESTDPPGAPEVLYSFFVAPTISIFLDDLESASGWTVGAADDNATTGIWERVDPNAIYEGTTMVQPEDDHTADPGVNAFITGQSDPGAAQGDNDVDGGKTTLMTPALNLLGYGTVTVRYYRWYTNDTGNTPGQDTWTVDASSDDGATWTNIESTTASDRSWRLVEVDLSSRIQITDKVRIRFVASDLGGGSVIEAGVDDVEVLLTGVVDAPETAVRAVFGLHPGRPNPFTDGGAMVGYTLDRARKVDLAVYDVQGRRVRTLASGTFGAGQHTTAWDGRDASGAPVPSGMYFYRLESEGRSQVQKAMRIE